MVYLCIISCAHLHPAIWRCSGDFAGKLSQIHAAATDAGDAAHAGAMEDEGCAATSRAALLEGDSDCGADGVGPAKQGNDVGRGRTDAVNFGHSIAALYGCR